MANWLRIGPLTPELACFHEAGHIATAHVVGARVNRVELHDHPRPHGRTKIKRNSYQAVFITCGGFAAEHFLFSQNRLVTASGTQISEAEFFHHALANAEKDLEAFAALTTEQPISELPHDFVKIAINNLTPELDFEIVQQLAIILLDKKRLEKNDVRKIVGRRLGWLSSIAGEYRMQRMRGYEATELVVRTAKALFGRAIERASIR